MYSSNSYSYREPLRILSLLRQRAPGRPRARGAGHRGAGGAAVAPQHLDLFTRRLEYGGGEAWRVKLPPRTVRVLYPGSALSTGQWWIVGHHITTAHKEASPR